MPLPAHIQFWIDERECHRRARNAAGTRLLQRMYGEVINHLELQGLGTPAKPLKMLET